MTIALSLSIVANARCNLVKVLDAGGLLGWFLDLFTPRSIGLWCVETSDGENVDIRDLEDVFGQDGHFFAARILGTTAICLGVVIWIVSIAFSMLQCSSLVAKWNSFLCICNCLFQGLVFLVFRSDLCQSLSCSLDKGGICGVVAIVVWFVAAILMFFAA